MIMAITVTILGQPNGVSFSLVAGAMCIIYATYAFFDTGTESYTTSVTFNINSTGAKKFRRRIHSNYKGISEADVGGNYGPGNYTLLLMYNGTYYYTPSYGYWNAYDDYHEG